MEKIDIIKIIEELKEKSNNFLFYEKIYFNFDQKLIYFDCFCQDNEKNLKF